MKTLLDRLAAPLRSDNPGRVSNTHDPKVSQRRFNDAVEASQRYYNIALARVGSSGETVGLREDDIADIWDALGIAQFWLGVAQTQLEYAGGNAEEERHFYSLASDRPEWSRRFLRMMRLNT